MEPNTKELEQDIEELKSILGTAKRETTKTILAKELYELEKQLKIVASQI